MTFEEWWNEIKGCWSSNTMETWAKKGWDSQQAIIDWLSGSIESARKTEDALVKRVCALEAELAALKVPRPTTQPDLAAQIAALTERVAMLESEEVIITEDRMEDRKPDIAAQVAGLDARLESIDGYMLSVCHYLQTIINRIGK